MLIPMAGETILPQAEMGPIQIDVFGEQSLFLDDVFLLMALFAGQLFVFASQLIAGELVIEPLPAFRPIDQIVIATLMFAVTNLTLIIAFLRMQTLLRVNSLLQR